MNFDISIEILKWKFCMNDQLIYIIYELETKKCLNKKNKVLEA